MQPKFHSKQREEGGVGLARGLGGPLGGHRDRAEPDGAQKPCPSCPPAPAPAAPFPLPTGHSSAPQFPRRHRQPQGYQRAPTQRNREGGPPSLSLGSRTPGWQTDWPCLIRMRCSGPGDKAAFSECSSSRCNCVEAREEENFLEEGGVGPQAERVFQTRAEPPCQPPPPSGHRPHAG